MSRNNLRASASRSASVSRSVTRVSVANAQQRAPVGVRRIVALVRCAVRRLRIHASGTMAVTFIGARQMRQINRQALGHDWVTDVLTFRYDGEPVVGEILIAPSVAKRYAKTHGIPYEEEVARYVVHGLLHWMGHEDATPAQQKRIHAMEDRLLVGCGVKR